MTQNKGLHVDVIGDSSIVNSDNLNRQDIYENIKRIDDWRMSRDLVLRLLINEDEEELEQHVLGIIGAPGTTVKPSLLEQAYGSVLSQRTMHAFRCIQDGKFTDNCIRRTQLHFVIFVTMAVENEFCQYIVRHCHERDKLRHFINECIKPSLAKLLSGELLTTSDNNASLTAFGISAFVAHCRLCYMTRCNIIPAVCH